MNFISILFATLDENRKHKINTRQPECFVDLNLDKVVTAIVKGREEYDISPFFYTPLEYPDDIYYRQGVIQDVAKDDLYNALVEYSTTMQKIREIGSRKENRYYHYQQRRWELECVLLYCRAVTVLHERLETLSLTSCGMTNFRKVLKNPERVTTKRQKPSGRNWPNRIPMMMAMISFGTSPILIFFFSIWILSS